MANPNPSPETRIRSGKEAEKKGRKGGINSGKTRRQMKTFKDALLGSLTPEKQAAMIASLERNAERGSLPHLEFLLEVLGQHPDQGFTVNDEETGVIVLPPIMGEQDE